jgi:1,4-alpha-glucan branching enzyme
VEQGSADVLVSAGPDWTKEQTYAGILALYRDLIHLRRNCQDTTRGLLGHRANVHHVNDDDNVIAFHRWDQGGPRDDVVVVVKIANRRHDSYRIGFPRPGTWKVRFNSDWIGDSTDFDNHAVHDTIADPTPRDGLPASAHIGIGRYTAIILSQDS